MDTKIIGYKTSNKNHKSYGGSRRRGETVDEIYCASIAGA
jgi:hypothetical protein